MPSPRWAGLFLLGSVGGPGAARRAPRRRRCGRLGHRPPGTGRAPAGHRVCMQGPPPEDSELPIMLPAMEPAMLEAWCAVGAQSGSTTDGGGGVRGVRGLGFRARLPGGAVPWCPSCPFPGAPPLPLPAARPRRRAAARVRPRPRARPRGQRWCFGSESSQAEAEAALVQQVRPSSCQNPCHGQGLA